MTYSLQKKYLTTKDVFCVRVWKSIFFSKNFYVFRKHIFIILPHIYQIFILYFFYKNFQKIAIQTNTVQSDELTTLVFFKHIGNFLEFAKTSQLSPLLFLGRDFQFAFQTLRLSKSIKGVSGINGARLLQFFCENELVECGLSYPFWNFNSKSVLEVVLV